MRPSALQSSGLSFLGSQGSFLILSLNRELTELNACQKHDNLGHPTGKL
jgi:hypothetical protein